MDQIRTAGLRYSEWRHFDAYLVWIYSGPPQSNTKISGNDCYSAWYVFEGNISVLVNGIETRASAGQWIVLPPGLSVREFGPGVRMMSINFDARWETWKRLMDFKSGIHIYGNEAEELFSLAKPMLDIVEQRFPTAYNHLPERDIDFADYGHLQGLFYGWLGAFWHIARQHSVEIHLPRAQETRTIKMHRWLDDLALDVPFRLEQMESAFGLSAAQLTRDFVAEFGLTPKRYFDGRRLNYAKEALVATTLTVNEITIRLGFKYLSEFSGWFKRQTGVSPVNFRTNNTRITDALSEGAPAIK